MLNNTMEIILSLFLMYHSIFDVIIDTKINLPNSFILYDNCVKVGNITLFSDKKTIMIVPSGNGTVIIYFDTGEVTFINCTPKQASLDFWKELSNSFYQAKDTISEIGMRERDMQRKHDLNYGVSISIKDMQELIGKQKDAILIDINGLPYRIKY